MAKFCGNCGARLDESTGLCPNCAKSSCSSGEEGIHSNHSGEHRDFANNPSGLNPVPSQAKTKKHIALKLTLTVLAIILVLAAAFGILYHRGALDLPFPSTLRNGTQVPAAQQEEKSIREICISYAEDYEVLTENQDGTKEIKVSAPDFAGITEVLCEEKQVKQINADVLQNAIQEYPELKKDYVFTAPSGKDQIIEAFLDRVAYELMLSAMEQVEIHQEGV